MQDIMLQAPFDALLSTATSIMSAIADNVLLLTLFSGSLVTVACGVVKKLMKTARC